jgi:hypothetical protein
MSDESAGAVHPCEGQPVQVPIMPIETDDLPCAAEDGWQVVELLTRTAT